MPPLPACSLCGSLVCSDCSQYRGVIKSLKKRGVQRLCRVCVLGSTPQVPQGAAEPRAKNALWSFTTAGGAAGGSGGSGGSPGLGSPGFYSAATTPRSECVRAGSAAPCVGSACAPRWVVQRTSFPSATATWEVPVLA